MIDSHYRFPYQRYLIKPLLSNAFVRRLSPASVTLFAALSGIGIILSLWKSHSYLAAFFLLLSGFCDILDGSLAREKNMCSNQGAFVDVLSDRFVESLIILGFYLYDPKRALFCLFMLAASYLCVTSFLLVGLFTNKKSEKSFYYSPGLIERSEAFIFFFIMMILPPSFYTLSVIYSMAVFWTACVRGYQFIRCNSV